jgi:hypothetical protein
MWAGGRGPSRVREGGSGPRATLKRRLRQAAVDHRRGLAPSSRATARAKRVTPTGVGALPARARGPRAAKGGKSRAMRPPRPRAPPAACTKVGRCLPRLRRVGGRAPRVDRQGVVLAAAGLGPRPRGSRRGSRPVGRARASLGCRRGPAAGAARPGGQPAAGQRARGPWLEQPSRGGSRPCSFLTNLPSGAADGDPDDADRRGRVCVEVSRPARVIAQRLTFGLCDPKDWIQISHRPTPHVTALTFAPPVPAAVLTESQWRLTVFVYRYRNKNRDGFEGRGQGDTGNLMRRVPPHQIAALRRHGDAGPHGNGRPPACASPRCNTQAPRPCQRGAAKCKPQERELAGSPRWYGALEPGATCERVLAPWVRCIAAHVAGKRTGMGQCVAALGPKLRPAGTRAQPAAAPGGRALRAVGAGGPAPGPAVSCRPPLACDAKTAAVAAAPGRGRGAARPRGRRVVARVAAAPVGGAVLAAGLRHHHRTAAAQACRQTGRRP